MHECSQKHEHNSQKAETTQLCTDYSSMDKENKAYLDKGILVSGEKERGADTC